MSRPCVPSGSVAMKMTSSTRSTSISGVTFMSAAGLRNLGLEDGVGAEVLVMMCHYCWPPARRCPAGFSVMRPMSSAPAARSWSIAAITAP